MKIYDIKLKARKRERKSIKFLTLPIFFIALFVVGGTVSYFTDLQISPGNTIAAAPLDFILSASLWSPSSDALDIDPGDSPSRSIKIIDDAASSTDFRYKVRPEMTGGDAIFCNDLDLKAKLEGSEVYSGDLFSFESSLVDFGESADDWVFDVSIPNPHGSSTCAFDFIYEGWQTNLSYLPGGFWDIEKISNLISSKEEECLKFSVRSHGYWKTHEDEWILPQSVGPEYVDSPEEAEEILGYGGSDMAKKLARELLALKFNIAAFGSGSALVPGEDVTLDDIEWEADQMLVQEASDPDSIFDSELENMKNRVEKVNKAGELSSCPTILRFIKIECPAYSDITGNRDAENLDDTGGNYVEFTNAPNFPNPYPFLPVDPSEIPPQCIKIPGWDFKLSSDEAQNNDVSILGQTDGDGEFSVPLPSLSDALKNVLLTGGRLWVSEVEQPEVAKFGAFRCYKDAINGDNLEFIRFDGGVFPENAFCIAYNVKINNDSSLPENE